jgi:hypothetical protein
VDHVCRAKRIRALAAGSRQQPIGVASTECKGFHGPVGWLSAYPLLPLLFRNPSDQACRNFTRVSLLRSGVTSSSAMQGMPRSSSTNPLKHDIEALADEPRIGALEGSGLAMPIARSRAAKRAATSQRSLSSMPASCALIAVSSVTTRDAFAGWVFLGSFATLCAVWRT